MTPPTPKQIAIEKAWTTYGVNPDDSDDGWIPAEYVPEDAILSGMLDLKYFRTSTDYDEPFYRPISLRNIEDNNGWLRIDEVGLPKESCNVFFKEVISEGNTDSEIHIGYWYNKFGHFLSYDDSEKYLFDEITHYKIIGKPNLPLY